MRICPKAKIILHIDLERWAVVLPKTAYMDNGSALIPSRFTEETPDLAIEKAWKILSDPQVIILAKWEVLSETIMVLRWNNHFDDWENSPEPKIPIYNLAKYRPKDKDA